MSKYMLYIRTCTAGPSRYLLYKMMYTTYQALALHKNVYCMSKFLLYIRMYTACPNSCFV